MDEGAFAGHRILSHRYVLLIGINASIFIQVSVARGHQVTTEETVLLVVERV